MNRKSENGCLKGREMRRKRQRDLRYVRSMVGVVIILAVGSAVSILRGSAGAAELVLERFFYSKEERAALEVLREASTQPAIPVVERLIEEDEVREKPQIFTLGGTVTDKNGVRGVWLNAQQYPSSGLPVKVKVQKPYTAGEVILQVEGKSKLYTLRPGQTLYLEDDRIRESYEEQPTPSSVSQAGSDEAPAASPESEPGPVGGVTNKP